MAKKIIIAIDGYAGCGKSTTARIVARNLNYIYIDSGAMYRAVTLYFYRHNINLVDQEAVVKALNEIDLDFHVNTASQKNEIYLNGQNVESEIRKMYISDNVSEVSKLPEVRKAMVAQQQKMGLNKGIVMDGRDIGTKVFPEAELKIFMTAEMQVRALRRQEELKENGYEIALGEIIENLQTRDQIDTTRKESPLVKAEDAILLDSTELSIEQQTEYVVDRANEMIQKNCCLEQMETGGQ